MFKIYKSKVYKCSECNYICYEILELELHQFVNDHYKTYVCPDCFFTTKNKKRYGGHFISNLHKRSKYRFDD